MHVGSCEGSPDAGCARRGRGLERADKAADAEEPPPRAGEQHTASCRRPQTHRIVGQHRRRTGLRRFITASDLSSSSF